MKIGYSLSSEETTPKDLVRYAVRAEQAGFSFALISDHFHQWLTLQGQSPFVWAVIGVIAQATNRIALDTGVTCPIMRIHPAIIAQAAATAALLMPDRFFLGLGTGENLNEHIFGMHWPPSDVRRKMLQEAVMILRLLWRGGAQSFRGEYFSLEKAQVFSLPEKPPPIMIAAAGGRAAELAGEIGDGLISTIANDSLVRKFRVSDGGSEKPRHGQVTVCWAKTEDEAKKIAKEWWAVAAIPGELMSQLATPAEFEAVAQFVDEKAVAAKIICGPDPDRHVEEIETYRKAGFDHVYIHQVGPDQNGFFEFYQGEILPKFK